MDFQSATPTGPELKIVHSSLAIDAPMGNPQDLAHTLTASLQTSLNVERQIKMAFDLLRPALSLDGIHYQHEQEGIRLRIGRMSKHSCNYQLASQGESFGQITFARPKRWQEQDLVLVENLLDRLVWPLRNALAYQRALNHAMFDRLTGIGNRLALETHLDREISYGQRYGTDLVVVMMDVDHFKQVNDLHGHDLGDQVLRELASRLNNSLRRTDAIFRYGGEEFTLIMPRTQIASARLVTERLLRQISDQPICGLHITLSMGLSQWQPEQSAREVMRCADAALYEAKHQGRNCVRAFAAR